MWQPDPVASAGGDMHGAPDRDWRPGLLAAIEAEFFALRRRAPNLAVAYRNAFTHAAGPDAIALLDAIFRAGDHLVAAMDHASRDGELAYHNRHHVVEVVLAMGWLCGAARRMGAVSSEEAALGVVAMVGHDLLHDGSPPGGGVMEARSADAVALATASVPLDGRQRTVLRDVILGTDPGRVAGNQARAAGELPPGPHGHGVDLVIAMANEADVFSSMLPNLGLHLTHRLAEERARAGHGWAADIADPGSRLAFLTTYARLTPAARALGACCAPGADRHFVAAFRRVAPVAD
jgi:hypothetical protein